MMSRVARLVVATTFAGSLLFTNTSCATGHAGDVAHVAPRLSVLGTGTQRLVQFAFGAQAAFGVCVEPACPAVTKKTLPLGASTPMQAAVHRDVATADMPPEPGPSKQIAHAPSLPAPAATVPIDAASRTVVVAFPFASTQLTPAAQVALSAAIQQARQSNRIVISGRTDAVGDDKINALIALARAISVRDYLRDAVPDLTAAISIDAKGSCCFVASNATADGRARNRRVEIAFFHRGGA
jgi:outer membrane protein OmpA-like peptidoglycan-associated protein